MPIISSKNSSPPSPLSNTEIPSSWIFLQTKKVGTCEGSENGSEKTSPIFGIISICFLALKLLLCG